MTARGWITMSASMALAFFGGYAVVTWLGDNREVHEQPVGTPPVGEETVLVFFASPGCGASTVASLAVSVRKAKELLGERARRRGTHFTSVGVAVTWNVVEGFDFLVNGRSRREIRLDFGPWDEVSAGRNWGNSLAADLLPSETSGCEGLPWQSIPQVFVVRREAIDWNESGQFLFLPPEVLVRRCGSDQIEEWVRNGTPIP